jgi:hypothetical protein
MFFVYVLVSQSRTILHWERKIDADLRAFALLGTPSVPSDYDYFALEDGGRLAAELVDRLATLVAVRRFPGMGATNSRPLRCNNNYVRMHHVVRRPTFVPSRRFGGDVRQGFMQRLSTTLHGTLGSYLRDALQEDSADALACFLVSQA